MLKRLYLVVVGALLISLLFGKVAVASTQDFTITSFTADYYLSKDNQKTSQLHTDETIAALFPNYDQNHGILRAIPKTYQGHTVSLKVLSVTDENGTPQHYTKSTQNGNEVLKIGDANTYVHGSKTYKISYDQRNVISFQDTGDEFYWDVNGDQWLQNFTAVTARLHIPAELVTSLQDRQQCFAGYFGATDQDCTITPSQSGDEKVITAEAVNLQPKQTLTMVVGFNKGTFVLGPEIAQAQRTARLIRYAVISATLLPPVITALLMYRRWTKFGRDPKGRGTIIAEYVPPKGFSVLSSSFLLKEDLLQTAMSAGVIELATKRYITIYEVKVKKLLKDKTDYELELSKDPAGLTEEQLKLIKAFFGDNPTVGSRVKIASLTNKLSTDFRGLRTFLGKDLTERGYFAMEPAKARSRYMVLWIVLIIAGLALAFVIVGFGLLLSGVIILIFSRYMPARTQEGVTIRDYLLGLKEFISVAEAERIKYLQSPSGAEKITIDINDPKQKVKLFEDLLPYAMIFGLEKQWAKQFEDVYKDPPDWYNGNWATFNAVYLMSSIGNLNSASAATFTPPASSSSSGFGGGGFSGGGGGGGGGGGW